MAALASSDITTTILDRRRYGKQTQALVKLAFGDSSKTYPSGGLALPSASTMGLSKPLFAISILDVTDPLGTEWHYDYVAGKLRATRQGHIPPIVLDEAVTLSSHTGTLKYPPAHIISAQGTISAAVTPLKIVPSSVTVATTQLKVNWTTGALTCFASDSVSALSVCYIPQQPTGPFSQANMAIDESITLSTSKVNFASRAATLAYCYQTTATAARLPLAHAVASGSILLDIEDSGNTSVDVHADNDAKVALVTYLKYSGFENNAGVTFIDQGEIALTSEVKEWGKTAGDRVGGLMIPGISGQGITEQDAAFSAFYFSTGATPANGVASWDIPTQVLTTAQTGDAEKLHDVPFLYLHPLFLSQRGPAELTTNDAPAATEIYALIYS